MSPKETGIQESEASFRKTKRTTIKAMILNAYESNQINEKLAYILIRLAQKVEAEKPAPPITPEKPKEEKKEGS